LDVLLLFVFLPIIMFSGFAIPFLPPVRRALDDEPG